MALDTRTITISIKPEEAVTLTFLPDLTGANGDVLLNKSYSVTTESDGTGSIELPVKSSGNIRWQYRFPKVNGAESRGYFYLSAGDEISLDELIEATGVEASNGLIDYIDQKAAELFVNAPEGAVVFGTGSGAGGDEDNLYWDADAKSLKVGGRLNIFNGPATPLNPAGISYVAIGSDTDILQTTSTWVAMHHRYSLDMGGLGGNKFGDYMLLATRGSASGGTIYGRYTVLDLRTPGNTHNSATGGYFSVEANTPVLDVCGLRSFALHGGSGATGTNQVTGLHSVSGGAHGGTLPLTRAVFAEIFGSGGAGETTTAVMFHGSLRSFTTGTITDLRGLSLHSWANDGPATITTSYGIYADSSIDVGATKYFIYSLSTSPSLFTGKVNFAATNTAGGTTGNQTINKPSGTVNIAAAGTSVTVTNSMVTANSIVLAVIRTADSTAQIKNVVPSSGSFTINLTAAATAETSIGFIVHN